MHWVRRNVIWGSYRTQRWVELVFHLGVVGENLARPYALKQYDSNAIRIFGFAQHELVIHTGDATKSRPTRCAQGVTDE